MSYEIIKTRRHKKLEAKDGIYKLLADSYSGGLNYIAGGHLEKYDREYKTAFETRLKRSVYINYLQPIVDLLIGFIFKNDPERKIPASLEYVEEHTSKRKGLKAFMQSVGIMSISYTVGVLVDSPKFDAEQIKTKADREAAGIYPYACIYQPWQIRDFATDDQMQLEWVLLDDTRVIKTDPMVAAEVKKIYRLWTKTYFEDFEIKEATVENPYGVTSLGQTAHPVGYVPFHFVNSRDIEDDYVTDSPMEDVAILSKQIYNVMSYLDEMLASGTFKTFFFPWMNKDELPEEIKKEGVSAVPVVGFNGSMSQKPYFDGVKLEEITPFKEALGIYSREIQRKVGMDVDRDKSYVQSGAAIGKEFQKTEALLISTAEALSEAEEFIFRTFAKWEGETLAEDAVEVEYSKDFQDINIPDEIRNLFELYKLGEPELRQGIVEKLAEYILPQLDAKKVAAASMERGPDFPTTGSETPSAVNKTQEEAA